MEGVGSEWMWGCGGCVAHLMGTPLGSPSLTSPAPILSANLSAPNPLSPPWDDLPAGVSFAMGLVDSGKVAYRLAEFQTPTNFDCVCDFNHNTFNRLPKITKIMIYTLYITYNV